jgi:glycosyltransferase involved in cell wall biosynthesis
LISIVIPASNEEQVIGRCLSSFLRDAAPGEFDVVVVANGCTDRTAAVAAGFDGVRVVDHPVASKVDALNLGDQLVGSFPRMFIDADVEVDAAAIRAVAKLLESGTIELAAPTLRAELAGRPWAVRAWYEVWQRLPYVSDNLVGAGFYGLSEAGRCRFQSFRALADDFYVWAIVPAARRRALVDHYFTVHPPYSLRSLVRIQARMRAFAIHDRSLFVTRANELRARHVRGLLGLCRHARLLPGVLVYLSVFVAAWIGAHRRMRSGRAAMWDRDDTARQGLPRTVSDPVRSAGKCL